MPTETVAGGACRQAILHECRATSCSLLDMINLPAPLRPVATVARLRQVTGSPQKWQCPLVLLQIFRYCASVMCHSCCMLRDDNLQQRMRYERAVSYSA